MQESKSCALPLGDGPSSYTDKTLNIFPIFFHLIKNPCHKQGYKRWIEGFEPSASRATIWRANQLRYTHHINVLGGIRTPDPRLRRPLLYPTELLTHIKRVMGIEPTYPAWKAGVLPLNYTRTFGNKCVPLYFYLMRHQSG